MFNSRHYDLRRLLWIMKTAQSWMLKIDSGIRENVMHRSLNEDIVQWLKHSKEIKETSVILDSWIEELERVIAKLNEELKND